MQTSSCTLVLAARLLALLVEKPACIMGVALMTLMVVPARAEPPASVSADAFLAKVSQSHPSLPMLEAAIEEARAELTAARVRENPALSFDREEVFSGGRGQPENFLRVEVPVTISGRRAQQVKATRFGVKAAETASARDRDALLFHALGSYWRAAAARQKLEVLRGERDALSRVLQAVRSRTAAGDTSGHDLGRLELELESFEDLVADAERELDARRLELGFLIGQPGMQLDATDPLALPARAPPLDDLKRQLLAARGDYQAARLRAEEAERQLMAAGRGKVPSLVLSGGAKSAEIEDRTAWGYLAGVSVRMPVFDRGQGEAARARARLHRARAEQRQIELSAISDVALAHAALTRTLAQAARYEQAQVPRLERLMRQAEVSYREGERPAFELLDTYRTARAVRLRRIELVQNAREAELELRRAAGRSPGGTE